MEKLEQQVDAARSSDSMTPAAAAPATEPVEGRKQQAIQAAASALLHRMGTAGPAAADSGAAPNAAAPATAGGAATAGHAGFLKRIEHAIATSSESAVLEAKKLVGDTGKLAHHIGDVLLDTGAEAVGVAELAGFRYPVTSYSARVSDALMRGSRVDAQQMAQLKGEGVHGIVNLCLENNDDAAPAAQLGLHALHVPILDNSPPTFEQMMQFVQFVQNAGNQVVYVHCEAGKGRTGTAVACYRMAADGWTADAAIAEARQYGLSLPNQIHFLQQFGERLKGGQPSSQAGT